MVSEKGFDNTINEEDNSKIHKQNSKLLNAITFASQTGPANPKINLDLWMAIVAAKAANIAESSINDAIKKPVEKGAAKLQQATYEGFAPSQVSVIVETITDNLVRTHHNVRSYFNKYGDGLLSSGSVSHLFNNLGVIWYPGDVKKEEEMLELAKDAGAECCKLLNGEYRIYCKLWDLETTKDNLEKVLGEPNAANTTWIPETTLNLDNDKTKEVLTFIEDLKDQADVQNVYSNLKLPACYDDESM